VLVLTTFDYDTCIFEALRAGAVGYLLNTRPANDCVKRCLLRPAGDSRFSSRGPAS